MYQTWKTMFPNTKKRVEKTMGSRVSLTNFKRLGNVVKSVLSG